jgi:molybdopterin-guanine dinucleotide biosynthesis protein A
MRVAGAVLAGGASSRMGRTKSLIEVGGVAMGRIVADVLDAAGCAPIAFIGGDATKLHALSGDFVADLYPGEGPLGGVLTALHHFEAASHVLVVACDLPLLDVETVRLLLDTAAGAPETAAVVANSGRREPGLVVWNRAALADIVDVFTGGTRAVHAILERIDAVDQRVHPAAMQNVNRLDDVPGSGSEGTAGQ